MTEAIKIAGAQIDVALGEAPRNLARMEEILAETVGQGARLTVFPECALSGYCFDSLEEAWPNAQAVPGPATQRLAELCGRLDAYVIFGLLEADGDHLYNACVLVGGEGVLGSYRKVHLPYLGIDRFTTPGDRFEVHDAGPLRVGMNICYDGAFPEPARVMALDGADLIALPTNWPPGAQCTAQFVTNARALENNVYYAAINRVGTERGFHFIGQSKICGPSGESLAAAHHDREEILYAQIDPAKARDKHLVRVPGKHEIDRFADRRPSAYGKIVEPVAGREP